MNINFLINQQSICIFTQEILHSFFISEMNRRTVLGKLLETSTFYHSFTSCYSKLSV